MTTVGIFHGHVERIGGAERVASYLAKGLVKYGYNVNLYIVVPSGINSALRIFESWMPPEVEIVTIGSTKERRFRRFSLYRNLEDFIQDQDSVKIAEQSCDIVVQTGGGLQPFGKTNHRRISYCNYLWQAFNVENKYRIGFWKLYSLPYGFVMNRKLAVLKHAEHLFVIANSNYTKQHLLSKWNFDDSNVSVIYPPVDIMKWQSHAYNEAPPRHDVVNVGRFSGDKNHELLFEIANGLSSTLTLIGNTASSIDELYVAKLKKIAPSNIRFLENIDENLVMQELYKTKVYLHSGHETFGLTVVEAIAAGCIPVVPDHSGHRETVPFPELRYSSVSEARNIIQDALRGKFDYLLPKLKSHIKQFDEPNFQSKMKNVIDTMLDA